MTTIRKSLKTQHLANRRGAVGRVVGRFPCKIDPLSNTLWTPAWPSSSRHGPDCLTKSARPFCVLRDG